MSEKPNDIMTIIKRQNMQHNLRLFQQKNDIQFLIEVVDTLDFLGVEECKQALIDHLKKTSRQKQENIGRQHQTERAVEWLKINLGFKLAKYQFFNYKQDFFGMINQAAIIREALQSFPKAQKATLEKKLREIIEEGEFPKDFKFSLAQAIDWDMVTKKLIKLGLNESELAESNCECDEGMLKIIKDNKVLESVYIKSVLTEQDV